MVQEHTEQVRTHKVTTSIQELKDVLHRIRARDDLTARAQSYAQRAQSIVDALASRISHANSLLVSINVLDNVDSGIRQAKQTLEQLESQPNDEQLAIDAGYRLDEAQVHASALPPMPFKVSNALVAEAESDYRRNLLEMEVALRQKFHDANAEAEQRNSELAAKVEELEGRIAQASANSETSMASVRDQGALAVQSVSEQTAAEIDKLREDLGSMQVRIDNLLDQQQANFADAEAKRTQVFTETQAKLSSENFSAQAAIVNQLNAEGSALLSRAQEVVAGLEKNAHQGSNLLARIAAAGVAGAYEERPRSKKGKLTLGGYESRSRRSGPAYSGCTHPYYLSHRARHDDRRVCGLRSDESPVRLRIGRHLPVLFARIHSPSQARNPSTTTSLGIDFFSAIPR